MGKGEKREILEPSMSSIGFILSNGREACRLRSKRSGQRTPLCKCAVVLLENNTCINYTHCELLYQKKTTWAFSNKWHHCHDRKNTLGTRGPIPTGHMLNTLWSQTTSNPNVPSGYILGTF